MTTQTDQCLIWGTGVERIVTRTGFDTTVQESARADGSYKITKEAKLVVYRLEPVQKAKLTTWVVDQHLQGEELPLITADIIQYAIARPSLQVHVRAFRLLQWIAQQTRAIGTGVTVRYTDPAALARTESLGESETLYLLNYLIGRGWIEGTPYASMTSSAMVTVDGYGHIADQVFNVDSTQAFVAMWFDSTMTEAYDSGIRPAIENTGYNPLKIDDKPDVDKIDDEIIEEIRRSRFLVADFTHGSRWRTRRGVLRSRICLRSGTACDPLLS